MTTKPLDLAQFDEHTPGPLKHSPEWIALENILRLIKTHGGEDASVNYWILCSVQKTCKRVLGAK